MIFLCYYNKYKDIMYFLLRSSMIKSKKTINWRGINVIIYSKENVNKLYFSPWCEYKFDSNTFRLYNYMQKREVVLNMERETALELINSLKEGINHENLIALFEKNSMDKTAEKLVLVLLANGIIE